MDILEIEKLMSLFGSLGVGVILGAGTVYLIIKSFIPSYLSEKGKNLATKEDIATITDKVESVKTDYAKVIEEIRSNNQLKHAGIEREKNIKKEVYLQAVEALTRTQNVVGSIANLEINEQEITKRMVDDSGPIAKVQIVGSESTVRAVTTIMGSIGTAIIELMLERSSLISRKNYIKILDDLRSKKQDEIERYISIIKNLNLEGNKDPHLWKIINENVDFETKQRDEYLETIDGLRELQQKEHFIFTKKCMDKFFEITTLLPDAVLAVREDLDLPISNEAYLDIFNKNTELGKEVFSEFFEKASQE